VEPRLIVAADADLEGIALFQQRCFDGHAGEAEWAAVQTSDYYLWKYTLLQPARIAELRCNGRLVAMCAAFPVQLSVGRGPVTGWQICDIATTPSERRKGFFKACMAVLAEGLPSSDVFFGFPNSHSAPQLAAIGWRSVDTLSPFAGVIHHRTAIGTVRRVDRFGDAQDLLVRSVAPSDRLQIIRSSAYMNARYCSALRPVNSCYVVRNGAEDCGWIVLRTLRLFGVKVSVIMDAFAVDAVAQRSLIRHAGFWSRQQGCFATVSFNNQWRAGPVAVRLDRDSASDDAAPVGPHGLRRTCVGHRSLAFSRRRLGRSVTPAAARGRTTAKARRDVSGPVSELASKGGLSITSI